jgi:hypothetical protein
VSKSVGVIRISEKEPNLNRRLSLLVLQTLPTSREHFNTVSPTSHLCFIRCVRRYAKIVDYFFRLSGFSVFLVLAYLVNLMISYFLYVCCKQWDNVCLPFKGIIFPVLVSSKARCLDRKLFLRHQVVPHRGHRLHYKGQTHKCT